MGLSAQDVLIGAAPAGSAPGPVDCPTVALPVPWLLAFSNQGHALRVFLMGFCMLRGRSLMLHRRWLCASAVAGVSWDGAFFFSPLEITTGFFGGERTGRELRAASVSDPRGSHVVVAGRRLFGGDPWRGHCRVWDVQGLFLFFSLFIFSTSLRSRY